MRTITKTISTDLYEFSELNKESQVNALNFLKGKLEDGIYRWLPDDLLIKASEIVLEKFRGKALITNIYYSLCYVQGDYVNVKISGEYYGYDFEVFYGNYGMEIRGDASCCLNDDRFERLKCKIYELNQELMRYGYSLIETYWSASSQAIISDAVEFGIISDEQLYLADGTIYND